MSTARVAAAMAIALALSGCATSKVALLSGEAGAPTGAVAVMDGRSGAERGQLNEANTETALGGAVRARPATGNYDALLGAMPPPPRVFTLYFSDGTTLAPESLATLAELKSLVTAASDVQITGHTDTVGDGESNDRLSVQRATEVRAALVSDGLPVGNARVTGRGEREPKVATPDNTAEPANRRVEVIVR